MTRLSFASALALTAMNVATVSAFVIPTMPASSSFKARGLAATSAVRSITSGASSWGILPSQRRTNALQMVSHPEVENEYKRKLSEQRRWTKSTKQIATLGPVSCTEEMIEKLFLAGADVFRLNFSHGKHEEKADLVRIIRALETKYTHPIAILADLQGPKLRVGTFEHDKVSKSSV